MSMAESTGQSGRIRKAPREGEDWFIYDRPKLYAKQEEAIFDPHRISIIEASTKSGKTAGCVLLCRL
jgi:hypothetical protein